MWDALKVWGRQLVSYAINSVADFSKFFEPISFPYGSRQPLSLTKKVYPSSAFQIARPICSEV
jgi:hypothetical protein